MSESQKQPSQLAVDFELLDKYNVKGPRYTSYPTALEFEKSESYGRILIEKLQQKASSREPYSLYFHLPFCRKMCWYCACTRVISRDQSVADEYLDDLEMEIRQKADFIGQRPVAQLHFGGGTPTFLSADQLNQLRELIEASFNFDTDPEISIEIDPREFNTDQLEVLSELGMNRASLGIQDTSQQVQEAINRIQPQPLNQKVVDQLRNAGVESINLDLIYGLPKQTPEDFRDTLEDALSLNPDRFAIYSYAHVPWINPAQKLLEQNDLPDASTKLKLLQIIIERLTSAGYDYIGMDHFAAPGDSLAEARANGSLRRNFQGYSTKGQLDIVAFGMSGISQIDDVYVQNEKKLDAYKQAVEQRQTPVFRGNRLSWEDKLRRDVIMRIMCQRKLDFNAVSECYDIDFLDYFAQEIQNLSDLQADGLVELHPDCLVISETGRLFLRNIAMVFDDYIEAKHENGFSKTV
jgi:oxygen-independent coproporphyrinogen-3 oxidase